MKGRVFVENQTMPAVAVKETGKKKSTLREYTESIVIALALALFIRAFVVQAFQIPSGSMEDTLAIGDHILVNKFIYGTSIPFTDIHFLKVRDPQRGDVVVFEFPEDTSKDFIKRIIGLPGDKIQIVNKQVYINDKLYVNPHEVHKGADTVSKARSPRDNTGVITVAPKSYFVMGDNRDNSYDSRFWGFVKEEKIKGLAFIKYWSWDKESTWVRWRSIGNLIH